MTRLPALIATTLVLALTLGTLVPLLLRADRFTLTTADLSVLRFALLQALLSAAVSCLPHPQLRTGQPVPDASGYPSGTPPATPSPAKRSIRPPARPDLAAHPAINHDHRRA